MSLSPPLYIKRMTAASIAAAFEKRPWLIIPVGTCEFHGPHLALGCDTLVVEKLADRLSAEFGVVCAPTIEFGVNDSTVTPGTAGVRRKTLRRLLNDLVIDWERQGVTEFLILTMNGQAHHQEALGTVVTEKARVRVVDILALDLAPFLEQARGPIHGGEADTSLMLHVAPEMVDMTLARDIILPEEQLRRYRRGSSLALPDSETGSVGLATRASAAKGERIFEHIVSRITERIFHANVGESEG